MSHVPAVTQQRADHAEAIIARLKTHASPVLSNYPVELAYLYGSIARKRPLPPSDIDVALLLSDEPPSSYERLVLEVEIQAALEDASQLSSLDVRSINQAPIMVQGTVVQEGILLYSRDKDTRVAFEVAVRKRYFDYLPTRERMERAFLRHIRERGLRHGQTEDSNIHSKQSKWLSE